MSIRRKFSNTSDLVEPIQSTILCEYYLWVRWCNIREINGYYIYNGMKGNKLSFVHQQNSNLIIYFHTISTDIHSSQTVENTYSFFSSNSYFMPQSSIPENREDDATREIKLNLALDSPRSTCNSAHDSNNSTPVSSPPQSPNHKFPPRLTPKNSMDEYLYNHWVIKHDNHILYYTKDSKDINSMDNEYPPSYGWKYNEKNASSLPKQYNAINFGAPPPGITRIPIIPEPMITFDNENDKNGIYTHGNSFKNGQTLANNNESINNITIKSSNESINNTIIPFDWPVHYMDVIFKLEPKQALPFDITMENPNSNILQISNINTDSIPYKAGLKQGDILISLNEEEIRSPEEIISKERTDNIIHMTVCRRIYDHIMIIISSCNNNKCNGKYYFHHLDEFNSPVFMQDIEQWEESESDYKSNNNSNAIPMIIRKAHYVTDTGESLWTISNKSEDFYVGLSSDMMPPNTNWEKLNDESDSDSPALVFYNGNRKMKLSKNYNNKTPQSISISNYKFAPPSKSYVSPRDISPPPLSSLHYRRPSWKKNSAPWDMELIIIEDEEMDKENNKNKEMENEWKTKYFTLYENLSDINETFYDYWLICKKYKLEINKLSEIINSFRNRFQMVRKELFEGKRREEDLLEKINSLQQTHNNNNNNNVSNSFDYELDIKELQENQETFDKITLKTEINELKVQLKAKDIKIRELEIDISSWQETHSQIYDSFTSATKKYGQQVEKFNEQEKYYKNELNELKKQIKNMQTRNSITDIKPTKKYIDIEAELEYNSDSSSSITDIDSDDEIGGGSHVRRSSKPWMQIKQKFDKIRSKNEKNNINKQHIGTPRTPITPITPLSIGSQSPSIPIPIKTPNNDNNNSLLSPIIIDNDNNNIINNNNKSPYLKTLISQQEDTELDKEQEEQEEQNNNNSNHNKLMSRTERLTKLGLTNMGSAMTLYTDISAITPDIGTPDIDENIIPTHTILHTHKAKSKVGDSILNGYDNIGNPMLTTHLAQSHLGNSMQLDSKMQLLAFRDSTLSLAPRDTLAIESSLKNMKDKIQNLEIENQQIIASKMQLLHATSSEIERLKNIINVVLNYPKERNIKGIITQMLKSN